MSILINHVLFSSTQPREKLSSCHCLPSPVPNAALQRTTPLLLVAWCLERNTCSDGEKHTSHQIITCNKGKADQCSIKPCKEKERSQPDAAWECFIARAGQVTPRMLCSVDGISCIKSHCVSVYRFNGQVDQRRHSFHSSSPRKRLQFMSADREDGNNLTSQLHLTICNTFGLNKKACIANNI